MTSRHVALAAGLVLFACTSTGDDAPDAGIEPTDAGPDAADAGSQPPDGGSRSSPFCAPDTVATTPSGPLAFEVRTDHYDLYAETTQEAAEEMGRLLEAAYPAMKHYFEAEPSLAAGERLSVRFYADSARWEAALPVGEGDRPTGTGGYYSPTTRTASLHQQASPYYTHVLLLHEAVHQFHGLSRVENPRLPFWLVEGVAEHLGRHDWDGDCVTLGVVPLLSWEDLPGAALGASIDVSAIVGGSVVPSRAASWALYHFLENGDGGAHRTKFKEYRDAMDANRPNTSFSSLVADPSTLATPLDAFIATAQEPMQPVFNQWTHVGRRAVLGDSGDFFSLAVTKAELSHFETRYDVPASDEWSVGVVLGYTDNRNYSALLVTSGGRLQTFASTAGNALIHDEGTAPASLGDGTGSISVDFLAGDDVRVDVNGTSVDFTVALPSRSGLSLRKSRAQFHHLDWD